MRTTSDPSALQTGPIVPQMLKLAAPMIVAFAFSTSYNFVDRYFVSRLGDLATAAVGMAFLVQLVLISLGSGIGAGVNSFISRNLGAGKQEEAMKATIHAWLMAVGIGLLFGGIGLLVQRPLFRALGASEPVLALITDYLTIIFLFAPLMLLLMFTNSVFQGWGNTIFPMIFMLTGTISNLVLDPLLIFGLGPFPRMEMQGAALATGLGRVLALGIAVVVLFVYRKPTRVRFSTFQFDWRIVSGILKVGFPSSLSQILTTLAMSIIFLILKPYGPKAKAVYTIVFTYEVVVFLPAIGVSQAIIIMTGHNFGACLLDRVRKIYWSGTMIALGMMGTSSVIVFLFPHFFAGIFARSREVHQMATVALRISAVGFAFISFYLCSVASFQGLGLGRQYLLANLTRLYVLEAPFAFLGSHWLGLNGVWAGMAVGNILSALLLILWYLVIFQRQIVTGRVQAV